MKIPFRLLLGASLALLAGCATHPVAPAAPTTSAITAPAKQSAPLLLISIDAFRADYFDRGLTPTLAMLAASGVHATAMQPSFPSLTFPNHYTLVTGLYPDHHGIVNNTMFDPVLGKFSLSNRAAVSDGRWWAEGTPIWETADAHGLRTATMFWPGSEADIHGKHPDYWLPYDGAMSANERVDKVLAWLDLPAAQRPRFLTLYFDEVDHAGHKHGPDSPEVNQALVDTDAALARLVAGLKQRGLFDRINLIVLADHGMAAAPPAKAIELDKLVPLASVRVASLGIVAGLNPLPGHGFAAVERVLEAPQPHMHCWDKTRIPARFHYGSNPRVPQLVCLANVGWHITLSNGNHPYTMQGEHGYDNADPRMRALFVAHGPAFQRGVTVPEFPNVDVYPLMAHLLDIPPAANDGDFDAVKGMLKGGE